jgi:hypothetical protein
MDLLPLQGPHTPLPYPPLAPSVPDGVFEGRIVAVLPLQHQRIGWEQRWLGHKARPRAVMRLGGMHEEGMTQVDRTRLASRPHLLTPRRLYKIVRG